MRRFLSVLLLTTVILTGGVAVYAVEAGSASDPLVTVSYAKNWADNFISQRSASTQTAVQTALSGSGAAQAALPERRALSVGDVITMRDGATMMLLYGSARVTINSGAFVNATVGAAAGNGGVNKNQLYIACENTSASVTVKEYGEAVLEGDYTVISAPVTFSDVNAADWFYSDVYRSVELGLINGVGNGLFAPASEFDRASAIKLAACMHQLYHEGKVSLINGEPWYKTYVDYAVNNGVIDAAYGSMDASRMSESVTRSEYVSIFYGALPESEYAAKNTVADDAIPDVKPGGSHASEIYTFYRAGILTGTDLGDFQPDRTITRGEVSAVLTRMFDVNARKSFTLN